MRSVKWRLFCLNLNVLSNFVNPLSNFVTKPGEVITLQVIRWQLEWLLPVHWGKFSNQIKL